MFAPVAFGISLGALVLFCVFALWERANPHAAYRTARARADQYVVRLATAARTHFAGLESHLSVRTVTEKVTHRLAVAIEVLAGKVQERAHEVTRQMARRKVEARDTRSAFLHEVETHKNNLDTERIKRETSLTDDQ